ncbi:MAG: hypothetical protein KJS68_09450 [Alphaproteobacteria bacterium]|nr:hypothetical protein [Alphaproteobacteria bacterium]MDE2134998.1 hypothetical protein [Alphaproteobacteria bacterium]
MSAVVPSTTPERAVYPPRIQAFRDEIIRRVPRVPNNKVTLQAMEAMATHRLILAFITWRMRHIPAKPRRVSAWSGGVSRFDLQLADRTLGPLLQKVKDGKDLRPHLSNLANTAGIVFPGARASAKRKDIDAMLIRDGLYHFHLGAAGPGNPKGRSGILVFAEILEDEFRIVALSDHSAFQFGTPEHMRLSRIARAYVARDISAGQAFMANPVMTSGHSMIATMFADRCDDYMRAVDSSLDDPAFIDKLYSDDPPRRDGQFIPRPRYPGLQWFFNDLVFGIFDETTMVFFRVYPFFDR